MAKEVYRIEVPVVAVDKYSKELSSATKQVTKFEQIIKKSVSRIQKLRDRLTKGKWSFTIHAIDKTSKVMSDVSSFIHRIAGRTYSFTIKAFDMTSRAIGFIKRSIFGLPRMISLGLSITGIDKLIEGSPLEKMLKSLKDSFFVEPVKPYLDSINKWIEENGDTWGKWKDTLRRHGENAAEWLFSRLEVAFNFIRSRYLDNDEFMNLDFKGKIEFILGDIKEWWDSKGKSALEEWWNSTGLPWAVSIGLSLGEAIFTGIINGMKIGFSIIIGMWKKVFEDFSFESLGGAIVSTLIMLNPVLRVLKTIKSLWDATFGRIKGKQKGGPPITQGTKTKPKSTADTRRGTDSTKQTKKTRVEKTPRRFKLPKWMTNIGGKIGLKGMAKLGGKVLTRFIPGVGWGLFAMDVGKFIYDKVKDNKAVDLKEISSYEPYAQPNMQSNVQPNVQSSVQPYMQPNVPTSSMLTDSNHSLMMNYDPSLNNIDLSYNLENQSIQPFIQENVYQPLHQAVGNATAYGQAFALNFVAGIDQSGVTIFEWIQQTLYHSISEAVGNAIFFGQAYSQNFIIGMNQTGVNIHSWISANLYIPTVQAIGNSLIFGQAYAKSFEIGLQENPINIHAWISENLYLPILQAVGNAKLFGSAFAANFIIGLNSRDEELATGARLLAEDANNELKRKVASESSKVTSSGAVGTDKDSSNVRLTDRWAIGTEYYGTYHKYADGGYVSRPHFGLVGEAGPEMIIPLSSGKRNRALDLFARTGEILGVRYYADGGLVGKAPIVPLYPANQTNAGVIIQNDIDVNPTIVIEGANTDDPDSLAEKIADKVAGIVADKVERVALNMPAI